MLSDQKQKFTHIKYYQLHLCLAPLCYFRVWLYIFKKLKQSLKIPSPVFLGRKKWFLQHHAKIFAWWENFFVAKEFFPSLSKLIFLHNIWYSKFLKSSWDGLQKFLHGEGKFLQAAKICTPDFAAQKNPTIMTLLDNCCGFEFAPLWGYFVSFLYAIVIYQERIWRHFNLTQDLFICTSWLNKDFKGELIELWWRV